MARTLTSEQRPGCLPLSYGQDAYLWAMARTLTSEQWPGCLPLRYGQDACLWPQAFELCNVCFIHMVYGNDLWVFVYLRVNTLFFSVLWSLIILSIFNQKPHLWSQFRGWYFGFFLTKCRAVQPASLFLVTFELFQSILIKQLFLLFCQVFSEVTYVDL